MRVTVALVTGAMSVSVARWPCDCATSVPLGVFATTVAAPPCHVTVSFAPFARTLTLVGFGGFGAV
jgi:hypothetical protein